MWEILVKLWGIFVNNSNTVIAGFTVVLGVTTIIYVVVSIKLLKQSKKALLADIILRVTGALRKEINEVEKEQEIFGLAFITAGLEGYCKAFMKIDKRMGKDFEKVLKVILDNMFKERNRQEIKLKEEMLEKNQKNKGSGTS